MRCSTRPPPKTYLCDGIYDVLVVIFDGNYSLAFKHPQISDDFSLQSFQGKPNKTSHFVKTRHRKITKRIICFPEEQSVTADA